MFIVYYTFVPSFASVNSTSAHFESPNLLTRTPIASRKKIKSRPWGRGHRVKSCQVQKARGRGTKKEKSETENQKPHTLENSIPTHPEPIQPSPAQPNALLPVFPVKEKKIQKHRMNSINNPQSYRQRNQ